MTQSKLWSHVQGPESGLGLFSPRITPVHSLFVSQQEHYVHSDFHRSIKVCFDTLILGACSAMTLLFFAGFGFLQPGDTINDEKIFRNGRCLFRP